MSGFDRRRILRGGAGLMATGVVSGLAGCSGGGGGSSTATSTPDGDIQYETATETDTATATPDSPSGGSDKLGFEGVMNTVPVPVDFDISYISGVKYLDTDQVNESQLPNTATPIEALDEFAIGTDWYFMKGPEEEMWSQIHDQGVSTEAVREVEGRPVYNNGSTYVVDFGGGEALVLKGEDACDGFTEGLVEGNMYADAVGDPSMEAVRRADESPGGAKRYDRSERVDIVGSMSLEVEDGRVNRDAHANHPIGSDQWYLLEGQGEIESAPLRGGTPISVYQEAIERGESVS